MHVLYCICALDSDTVDKQVSLHKSFILTFRNSIHLHIRHYVQHLQHGCNTDSTQFLIIHTLLKALLVIPLLAKNKHSTFSRFFSCFTHYHFKWLKKTSFTHTFTDMLWPAKCSFHISKNKTLQFPLLEKKKQ